MTMHNLARRTWSPLPTVDPRCGQLRGYAAHRKRNEDACRPCKDAVAANKRSRRAVLHRPVAEPVPVRPVRLSPQLAPVAVFGLLAALEVPHDYTGPDVSQCELCWGFRDDPRHWLPEGGRG